MTVLEAATAIKRNLSGNHLGSDYLWIGQSTKPARVDFNRDIVGRVFKEMVEACRAFNGEYGLQSSPIFTRLQTIVVN